MYIKVNIYSSQEVNHLNHMCILHTVINDQLNEMKKTKSFFTSVSYKTIPWPSNTCFTDELFKLRKMFSSHRMKLLMKSH